MAGSRGTEIRKYSAEEESERKLAIKVRGKSDFTELITVEGWWSLAWGVPVVLVGVLVLVMLEREGVRGSCIFAIVVSSTPT